MERKLAAIFSADVKGYSRLMGEDEEATSRTLSAYRQEMATLICQHRFSLDLYGAGGVEESVG
jgi:class 3 adenylate cyclase